jgi:excisionase family DNA binding protein
MTWLTTAEVAEVIRETRENVSRRCKRGDIEAVQIGRNWRISEAALEAFLTPKPTAAPVEPTFITASQKRRHLQRAS